MRKLVFIAIVAGAIGNSASRSQEYALILEDPPVVQAGVRSRIQRSQAAVTVELQRRKIKVTGSVDTLANAMFVMASRERVAELRSIPGVKRVQYLPPPKLHLDRALDLVQATQAWASLGGESGAGAGVKIAIIDSGIAQNHAAFQDSTLQPPAGFPKGNRAFTNNKVIVARSYIDTVQMAGGTVYDTRPDDLSPTDRVGHGTAVAMIAAGRRNTGPLATITGVAPKAFLGNYKVFGTPGVNQTLWSAVAKALDDAYNDGMDIAVLALGSKIGLYGPLDKGVDVCGDAMACDIRATSVENAVRKGMTVVVSAGDDGLTGNQTPTLNSISTPGTAPSAITVGASTNSRFLYTTVSLQPPNTPSNLTKIPAMRGDGPQPFGSLGGPLRDAGLACDTLGTGSLTGAIALVQRGTCGFTVKVTNAQQAGAVGVILYNTSDGLFPPVGLARTAIPTLLIGNADGLALQSFLVSNRDRAIVLNGDVQSQDDTPNVVASFSSRGPNIGDYSIKPELVAPGSDIYTATQSIDPNSDLYNASGYTGVSGSSFAVPMVAGAVALVKQKNPGFTPAQLKSAVVNTAATDVSDSSGAAPVTAVGAGKLNIAAAVSTTVTADPATLSFGAIATASLPIERSLRITNTGTTTATLTFAVTPRSTDNNASIVLSKTSTQLAAGASDTVNVTLRGATRPLAGAYEGVITVTGAATALRIPYLYLVGDGVAHNIIPLYNSDFEGIVNDKRWGIAFKVIDQYGVPVPGLDVRFSVTSGNGAIEQGDQKTDVLGIGAAYVNLGPVLGEQSFRATAGTLTYDFFAFARSLPAITEGGIVNAASPGVSGAVAPGSYVSIFGSNFTEATKAFQTPYLPYSLAGLSVSFDIVDSQGNVTLTAPGRIHFVSPTQINVQVPWEMAGRSSAKVKVSLGDIAGEPVTVSLKDAAPAAFEAGGLAVATDASNVLITAAHPATRGQVIVIYANGLGPVSNQPPSGEGSPSAEPLARTKTVPVVTIGGKPAQVQFSGLTPYFVGLYQINVAVPIDADTGRQPLVISVGGVTSKSSDVLLR